MEVSLPKSFSNIIHWKKSWVRSQQCSSFIHSSKDKHGEQNWGGFGGVCFGCCVLSNLALDSVFLPWQLDVGITMTNEENKQFSYFCKSCCRKRQKWCSNELQGLRFLWLLGNNKKLKGIQAYPVLQLWQLSGNAASPDTGFCPRYIRERWSFLVPQRAVAPKGHVKATSL